MARNQFSSFNFHRKMSSARNDMPRHSTVIANAMLHNDYRLINLKRAAGAFSDRITSPVDVAAKEANNALLGFLSVNTTAAGTPFYANPANVREWNQMQRRRQMADRDAARSGAMNIAAETQKSRLILPLHY